MSNPASKTPKTNRITVLVMKGDNLVERGEYWTGGAGLAIAIEDENLWNQVRSGVEFLMDEPAAISVELECGWDVHLLRKGVA